MTEMHHRRRALGVSQKDLADAIGVRQPNISIWETGGRPIPPARLPAISEALGVPEADLQRDHDDVLLDAARL